MSDAIDIDELFRILHRQKYGPLTPEQAELAYAEAAEVPVNDEEIQRTMDYVLSRDREST